MLYLRECFGYLLLLCAPTLAFSISLHAQNPVSLSISVKPAKAKPGDKLNARVSASIAGGWHMYSLTQDIGDPIPTKITVADGERFKLTGSVSGSAPRLQMDTNFGIMTEFYEGQASFSVPILVDASAQPGTQILNTNVRCQACDYTTCLPPKTGKLTAPVEIIAGTRLRLRRSSLRATLRRI